MLPEPEDPTPKGENIPLDILYEDDDLIVISKPAGLVVHPAAGNWTGTLVNALIYHCGDSLSGIGGVRRPGIVHRLDKDTTGVMVVAKNDIAHRHLSQQFADHGRTMPLERAYQAIVWGRPRSLSGTIDAPLGRADRRPHAPRGQAPRERRMPTRRSPTTRCWSASTKTRTRRRSPRWSNATWKPAAPTRSASTWPISAIRCSATRSTAPRFKTKANLLPEAARKVVNGFARQALHAYMLQFEHPRTGEVMHFEVPLPDDMVELVEALRR